MIPLITAWKVPGHDATRLVADAYLPATLPAPTVVLRTPYGRAAHRDEGAAWARRGFAFVVQDVRGRYDSDGTWQLYANERSDGAALVDAVITQNWSDGRVITTGGSYAGFTAWTMAVERPEHVRAVVSTGPAMGLHRVKWDASGILRLAEHVTWWLERADGRTTRDGAARAVLAADPTALAHLPVRDMPQRLRADLPGWARVVDDGPAARPPDDVTDAELDALPAAVLHIGGWHDLLVTDTLHHWARAGSTVTPRPPRTLVVGPWDHSFVWGETTAVGDREYGETSRLSLGEMQVAWLREVLDGTATSGARVFEIGSGWGHGTDWPPQTTVLTLWPDVSGTLSSHPPATAVRVFRHDPDDPYPSVAEAADRRALLTRTDVVRFTGPVLERPLHIAGTARAYLDGRADGAGGDWVVRLLEHRSDGSLISVTAGTVSPQPGDLDLDPVAIAVPAGSRLVLEITGADFPRLCRNLGVPGDRYRGTRTRAVDHHLTLGRGTRIDLPVVSP